MATASTLSLVASPPRTVPSSGLEAPGGEWTLDLERHGAFIESVTDLPVGEDPSDSDCYRIRNRLEALVAEYYRTGEWPDVVYEASSGDVRVDEIVDLARFFRFYLDAR